METKTQTIQRPKTVMEEQEITVQEPRTVMETKQIQVPERRRLQIVSLMGRIVPVILCGAQKLCQTLRCRLHNIPVAWCARAGAGLSAAAAAAAGSLPDSWPTYSDNGNAASLWCLRTSADVRLSPAAHVRLPWGAPAALPVPWRWVCARSPSSGPF